MCWEVYNFKRGNFDLFREAHNMVPWNRCLLNNTIDENWRNFKVVLFHIADQCIPRTLLKSKKRMYWLSDYAKKMVRQKRRAYLHAKRTGKPNHFKKYRNISNVVRNLSRQDHTQHIQDITSNLSQDQRPLWRWLKNFKNKSTRLPGINYTVGQP